MESVINKTQNVALLGTSCSYWQELQKENTTRLGLRYEMEVGVKDT